MNNPFLEECNLLSYMPDIHEAEQAMVDSALRDEIESGRLSVNVLDGPTWMRVASDYQRSVPT